MVTLYRFRSQWDTNIDIIGNSKVRGNIKSYPGN